MSTYQAQPLILTIGSQDDFRTVCQNDDFLHVYQNTKELLADNAVGPGPGQFSGPIEFFDSDGHRFAGVYDQQRNLLALTPTADPPNFPALLQWVRNAFDRVRSFIEDNPEEAAGFDTEVMEALAQLPHLSNSAELRKFLQVFVAVPVDAVPVAGPDGGLLNPGSSGHNAIHVFYDHG